MALKSCGQCQHKNGPATKKCQKCGFILLPKAAGAMKSTPQTNQNKKRVGRKRKSRASDSESEVSADADEEEEAEEEAGDEDDDDDDDDDAAGDDAPDEDEDVSDEAGVDGDGCAEDVPEAEGDEVSQQAALYTKFFHKQLQAMFCDPTCVLPCMTTCSLCHECSPLYTHGQFLYCHTCYQPFHPLCIMDQLTTVIQQQQQQQQQQQKRKKETMPAENEESKQPSHASSKSIWSAADVLSTVDLSMWKCASCQALKGKNDKLHDQVQKRRLVGMGMHISLPMLEKMKAEINRYQKQAHQLSAAATATPGANASNYNNNTPSSPSTTSSSSSSSSSSAAAAATTTTTTATGLSSSHDPHNSSHASSNDVSSSIGSASSLSSSSSSSFNPFQSVTLLDSEQLSLFQSLDRTKMKEIIIDDTIIYSFPKPESLKKV